MTSKTPHRNSLHLILPPDDDEDCHIYQRYSHGLSEIEEIDSYNIIRTFFNSYLLEYSKWSIGRKFVTPPAAPQTSSNATLSSKRNFTRLSPQSDSSLWRGPKGMLISIYKWISGERTGIFQQLNSWYS